MKKNNKWELFKHLTYFTQISALMIVPIILYTFIAWWVVNRFELSNIFVILALLLGVAVGLTSCYKFMQTIQREAEKSERENRP